MIWTKLTDKYPGPDTPILLHCLTTSKKSIVLRACWVPKHSISCKDDDHFDGGDYCEEKDDYFWPEGFYEWNQFDETRWQVDLHPTHWMTLPESPYN